MNDLETFVLTFIIFDRGQAAPSSNSGIVRVFRGTTRVLEAIKFISYISFNSILK